MLLNMMATLALGGAATAATFVGVNLHQAEDEGLRVPCGAVWDRLPADLQDDLRELKAAEPAQREKLAEQIRADALDGEYGRGVQRFAERRQEIRARVWTRLPEDLRTDVEAARALPADQRPAAYAEIREGAVAGEYGEWMEQVAAQLAERREVCGDVTD